MLVNTRLNDTKLISATDVKVISVVSVKEK